MPTKKDVKLTNRQKDNHRASIDVAMIKRKLEKHITYGDDIDPETGRSCAMSGTQVNAAKLLLDKSLPSLQAVDSTVTDKRKHKGKEEIATELEEFAKPKLVAVK